MKTLPSLFHKKGRKGRELINLFPYPENVVLAGIDTSLTRSHTGHLTLTYQNLYTSQTFNIYIKSGDILPRTRLEPPSTWLFSLGRKQYIIYFEQFKHDINGRAQRYQIYIPERKPFERSLETTMKNMSLYFDKVENETRHLRKGKLYSSSTSSSAYHVTRELQSREQKILSHLSSPIITADNTRTDLETGTSVQDHMKVHKEPYETYNTTNTFNYNDMAPPSTVFNYNDMASPL